MITKLDTFYEILPWPETISSRPGDFNLQHGLCIAAEPSFNNEAERLKNAIRFFDIDLKTDGRPVKLIYAQDIQDKEAYRMTVTPEAITLEAKDAPGMAYAVAGLIQMLAVVTSGGPGQFAGLSCGSVEDRPRFKRRAFMLDSSRHFQSVKTIEKLLRTLAHFRFNTFHWHLTDNEGWRVPSEIFPNLAGHGEFQDGMYSYEDIRTIRQLARELHIHIVPEIDWPGHSRRLIQVCPSLGCHTDLKPGDELCVGNPDVRKLASRLLDEFIALFPESTEIHLGGDEANDAHWKACPCCQQAMKQAGFRTLRELEHDFMMQQAKQVLKAGKRPIVWCDSGIYPTDVIEQLWCSRCRNDALKNGNDLIESSCSTCYFDRLFDRAELQFSEFQNFNSVEDNYLTEPAAGHPECLPRVLGLEACSWTEYLPERLLMKKIMPRLPALAEAAWGNPEHRIWSAFQTRNFRQAMQECETIW